MQPSQSIITYIAKQEGFVPHAYADPPGNSRGLHSIGYGHQIQPNETYLLTASLSPAQGLEMLQKDIASYAASVNQNLKRPVTQAQFDAMVDLAYNTGTGTAAKVMATWNTTGSVADTVAHLKLYNHADGKVLNVLTNRRNYEANLFSGLGATISQVVNAAETGVDEVEKKSPGQS